MKTQLALLFLLVLPAPGVMAQLTPHHQTDFPAAEFVERRARVFDAIGDNAIVLLQGAPNVQGFVKFRQSNSFYYLTGVEVPRAYLMMDGHTRRTRLFLPPKNAGRERGEGVQWSAESH